MVACIAFSVKANRELVKDVLTCTALTPSIYKTRHPNDTDDPEAVGGSSEDEAEDMGEVLGISHRLPSPSTEDPTPALWRVVMRDLSPSRNILTATWLIGTALLPTRSEN